MAGQPGSCCKRSPPATALSAEGGCHRFRRRCRLPPIMPGIRSAWSSAVPARAASGRSGSTACRRSPYPRTASVTPDAASAVRGFGGCWAQRRRRRCRRWPRRSAVPASRCCSRHGRRCWRGSPARAASPSPWPVQGTRLWGQSGWSAIAPPCCRCRSSSPPASPSPPCSRASRRRFSRCSSMAIFGPRIWRRRASPYRRCASPSTRIATQAAGTSPAPRHRSRQRRSAS